MNERKPLNPFQAVAIVILIATAFVLFRLKVRADAIALLIMTTGRT